MKDIKSERNEIIKMLEENGLYIVQKSDFEELAELSEDSFTDYPLPIYIFGEKYYKEGVKQTMRVNLYSMYDEGIIYADSKELTGFSIFLPPGYDGAKFWSFMWNGGLWVALYQGYSALKKMGDFESFAISLKKNIPTIKIGIVIIYV